MKDNGKMDAVQHCATCQHLGKSERCQNCRNGNPPADAAAYDLLWENDAREFTPGEVVMWAGSECTVLSVCGSDGAKMLELLKLDVDEGNSGEFMISRNLVPACVCGKQVHEMTAKEYAEKLREYFRKPEIGELDIQDSFCSELNCKECAFNAEANCVAMAGIMFDPERALQMIREAESRDKRDKPKGKTYREDFFEKFPNADRTAAGLPMPCRNKLYFEAAPCSANPRFNCDDCWNEEMPEADDAE